MKVYGRIWVEPREKPLAPVGEGFLFKFIVTQQPGWIVSHESVIQYLIEGER